jgi:putative transposase
MLPPKKTMRRFDVPGTARFITFSCYRRHRLFDNDRIKDRFVERLVEFSDLKRMSVLAWVVMPEHVHLVLFPEPAEALSAFLATLKRCFSTEVFARWRELDAGILPKLRDRSGDTHFWQLGGGYDRNVVGDELLEKVRYCHRNPIARGLVARSVDWRWSSARAYESLDTIGPPIALDLLPVTDRPMT